MVATTKDTAAAPTAALVKVEPALAPLAHHATLVRPIARPAEVVAAIQETQALLREILVEGVDYGVIPGTGGGNRRVLLKPGAEKISIGFGCHPEYELLEREVDHERVMRFKSAFVEAPKRANKNEEEAMKKAGTGRFRKVDDAWQWQEKGDGFEETVGIYRFRYKCKLVRFDGQIVGEGEGVCSTLESKYRSRPHDVENTILKMGQKRARIAATLDAFGLSEAFTQDIGDDEHTVTVEAPPAKSVARQAAEDTKDIMREAGAAAGARDDETESNRMAAALTWSLAFLDKVDKIGVPKPEDDDDAKKGAAEAFAMLCEENETAQQALVTQAPKLHFAVLTYINAAGATIHGMTYTTDDREKAALTWLHGQRGPRTEAA